MSEIITSNIFVVSSGVVASDYIVDVDGEIDIESGGILTDSIATNGGFIYVYPGAVLERTSSFDGADIWLNGSASGLVAGDYGNIDVDIGGVLNGGTVQSDGYVMIYAGAAATSLTLADGGMMINYGGTVQNTVVSGGSFTAQNSMAETASTTVLEGGTMRVVSGAVANDTTVNGGQLDVVSGGASKTTVFSGGTMNVSSGNSITSTTLTDATLLLAGMADSTILNGGVMRVTSGGEFQNTAIYDGQLEARSATATDLLILGGSADLFATTVTDMTVGSSVVVTADKDTTLNGALTFAYGASVVLDGTLAFDTAYMTMVDAQVIGMLAVSGDTTFTLTGADTIGSYKLATDAIDFNSDIQYGEYTLTMSDDVVKIGDLYYKLLLANKNELMLKVMPDEDGDLFFTGKFAGGSTSLIARSVFGYVEIFTPEGKLWGTMNMGYSGDFVSVGDFNGDGLDDILRTNYSGQFFYDLSNGDGTFISHDLGFDTGTWDEMGTGDFSGNGIDDILLADPNAYSSSDPGAGQLAYKEYNEGVSLINVYRDGWEMIGTGYFGTASSTAPDAPQDVKADMLWENDFEGIDGFQYHAYCVWITDSPEGSYWRMLGAVKVDEWSFLGVGDFNGDGTTDFAMINYENVVALGGIQNGTLSYWAVLNGVDTSEWRLAGIGDFNGDGTDDIAWCNSSNLAGYWQINNMTQTDWGTIGVLA